MDDYKVFGIDFKELANDFELRYSLIAYVLIILSLIILIPLSFAHEYYRGIDPDLSKTWV